MDVVTVRLEPELIENLDAEYEHRGFRNRTLYIRRILEERDAIFDDEGAEIDAAERLTDHDKRLSDVEERLDALEDQKRLLSWMSSSS